MMKAPKLAESTMLQLTINPDTPTLYSISWFFCVSKCVQGTWTITHSADRDGVGDCQDDAGNTGRKSDSCSAKADDMIR
jgi:hypothetical protein